MTRLTTAMLVMTDGRRECIARTIPSMLKLGEFDELWIHDDSADDDYTAWLESQWPDARLITPAERQGFGGAIRNAWGTLSVMSSADRIFHLEDDFVLVDETTTLEQLHRVLDVAPQVAQVALLRQPWNDDERRAGGIMQQHSGDFTPCWREHDGDRRGIQWVEHRRFFTTNPSLYRRELIESTRWPEGANSEGRYGIELFKSGGVCSAFLGDYGDRPRVEHIGVERAGGGY